jgi:hypothetical protein
MVGIALALFWVPGFNGLIAGLVGGHRAGTLPRAIGLSVAAAAATSAIYAWLFSYFGESFTYLTWGIPAGAYIAMTAGLMVLTGVLSPLIETPAVPEGTVERRGLFRRRRVVVP